MRKLLSIPAAALLIALSACSSAGTGDSSSSSADSSQVMNEEHSSHDAMMSEEMSSQDMSEDTASSAAQSHDTARVINMTVENWKFTPNAITLKKGETVTIHLTDTTGVHSFMSNDLGLNVAIQPGETKDIVIPTDQAGTFSFRCGVPCGPGHKDMTGTITIQ